jgi:hypothetical protein
MFSKIDVFMIIRDHLSTLKDNHTKKTSWTDFLLFFGLPLVLSVGVVSAGVVLDKDLVNLLIAIFSIFVGLLFNLLLLIFDIAEKQSSNSAFNGNQKKFKNILREIYVNISFAILVSVISIAALLLFFLRIKVEFVSFLGYSLFLIFLLTLLMILKRIYKLLSYQFDNLSP